MRTGIRQSLRASDARAVEFFFPNLLLPQQAPRWFEQVLDKAAAAAIDVATAGEPRNLDLAWADLVASECQGCTLLNAGCAKDVLFTSHTGASCPIPSGAFGQCPACQREVCDAGCQQRQDMRLIRATFLALVLAAFRVDDLKSASAVRIFSECEGLGSKQHFGIAQRTTCGGRGCGSADSEQAQSCYVHRMAASRAGCGGFAMAADQGALSLSSFLRKFATVNLAGYSGAQVSAVRLRDVAGGGGGAGGAGAGAAEMAELQRQVQDLQRLSQQHEESRQMRLCVAAALQRPEAAVCFNRYYEVPNSDRLMSATPWLGVSAF